MEGKNSKADVVLGLTIICWEAATQPKFLLPKAAWRMKRSRCPAAEKRHIVPFDYGYFAFVYDKSKLKKSAEKPERTGRERSYGGYHRGPAYQYAVAGLLLRGCAKPMAITRRRPRQKLAAKTATVTKGWSEAYGLFLKGGAICAQVTISPLRRKHIIEEKKDNYAAANFSEGHYLQVEVAARTVASKQPELARRNSSNLWFLRRFRTPYPPATGCTW